VLLWGLLLSFVMVRLAIIIPISHFYQVIKMKSAKPESVPTTSFEYYRSYLLDFVSNYTSTLRNYTFSCYANLTLPEFWNFGYSWDYQTMALFHLAALHVFLVWGKIKPWCRHKCHGINLAFSRYPSARCPNATSSPTTDTAASTTSAANIAAPATAPAATPPLITGSAATPTLTTGTAATPSLVIAPAAVQTPTAGTMIS